ncbi:MAG TPA: twin-arginine translocation pathway signal protein [Alphaproteobacteria bacterium]|nr:twin-arginine translocation pathway signal protein [Alphaproteobacteria bacterium]
MPLSRRAFIRLAGGGTLLAASGAGLARCDGMPAEAVAAWRVPPAGGDPRRFALAHAILAPNPHNMQPWLVDLREPGVATLHVDRTRLLPETDPYGRQVLIGHGTFLELLDLAAGAAGHRAEIRLFPEGAPGAEALDDRPVARIAFAADPARAVDPLFHQIAHRRSNKEAYEPRPLAADHAAALASFPVGPGLRLGFATTGPAVETLRGIADRAMTVEMTTPRTLRESIDRTRIGAAEIARHRDGIDLHGPLFWWTRTLGLMTPEKAATPGTMAYRAGLDYAKGAMASAAAFGWLASADNGRAAQIAAGRAYVRLNLAATAMGVAMHPLSQALQEYPEMAEARRAMQAATAAGGETVQMFFRLGYAAPPPPSPRRDLDAILRA